MEHPDLAQAAAVLGALGVALVLLPRGRAALLTGFAALGAAEAMLGAALVPEDDLRLVVERPALAAAAAVGLVAVLALAALLVRRPAVGTVLLLLAAPFRLPVTIGDTEAFLLVPFYAVLAAAVLALVGVASLFAAIGLWQAWTKTLFFARDLEVANAYTSFFRVTSLFKDPSLYGRHLVIAIAVVLVVLMLGRAPLLAGTAAIAFLFVGLLPSYSQSSLLALFVVTAAVGLAAGDRQTRLAVGAACALCALVGAGAVAVTVRDSSPQKATSGRANLVRNTTEVWLNHPVAGVGIGAQPIASRLEVNPGSRTEKNTSHTTPLTIAAETGVIGIAAYVAFLLGALWLLVRTTRLDRGLGLALAATFLVLVVHSLVYSGFLEDPLTWATLGLGSGALAARRVVPEAAVERHAPRGAPAPAGVTHGPAR